MKFSNIFMLAGIILCIVTKSNAKIDIGDDPAEVHSNLLDELEANNMDVRMTRVGLLNILKSTSIKSHEGACITNTAIAGYPNPRIYDNGKAKYYKLTEATELLNNKAQTQETGIRTGFSMDSFLVKNTEIVSDNGFSITASA